METATHIPISRSVAFPDLEPAAGLRRRRPSRVLSQSLELAPKIELIRDSVSDEPIVPSGRKERESLTARLTVYVLSLILMVIFFPAGLAMLVFNILSGENIRTTSHAIALTGTATALAMTELGQSILGAL
ncbi:MAG: hypothetical protein AAF871_04280 [Pseudomonadota bacterium]